MSILRGDPPVSWSTALAIRGDLRTDREGAYLVDGLDGFASADLQVVGGGSGLSERAFTVEPCVDPAGPFGLAGLIAMKFYVCVPGLEDRLVQFERDTQAVYYSFMAPVRWRYGGLCRVSSQVPLLGQPFAEVYSIDTRDRGEAEALDAATKPEPPHIVEMFRQCSEFLVPGLGRWVWFAPR